MIDLQITRLDVENQEADITYRERINAMTFAVMVIELRLKEEKIREALIALGWTPPGEVTVTQALEAVERLPSSVFRSAALDELTDLLGYLDRQEQRAK